MKVNILVSALVAMAVSAIAFVGFRAEPAVAPAQTEQTYGAVASPDSPFRWMSVGGVRFDYGSSKSLNQGTSSVLCSIQSPVSTSTLAGGGIQITTATSGVTSLSISKSVQPYVVGTTAVIATTTVASGAQASLNAASSTVNAEAMSDIIFTPSTYFVVAQDNGGVLNQTGSCHAVWREF